MTIDYVAAPILDRGGAVFNVMHPNFGATGNGTTIDGPAIQAAINAASAAGGGCVIMPYTTTGYNIGSLSPGLSIPSYVSLECPTAPLFLKYAGTGISIDTLGSQYTSLRNLYVICSNDAASGIRFGGTTGQDASRWCRMDNFAVQGTGVLTTTGTGIILDSGAASFSAYLHGRQVYSLGFKIGMDVIGQTVGNSTWTTVNFDTLVLGGKATAPHIAGSIGIRTDVNTNLQSSTIRAGVIEGFVTPLAYAAGAGCFGFNFEGGIESNDNAPAFPATYNGLHYDNHADLFFWQSTNGASFAWFREQIASGQWFSESFDDRVHTLADGSSFDQVWGLRRGGSDIDGTLSDDKFIVSTSQKSLNSVERNWWKLLEYKFAVGGAVPTSGAWSIGSVIFNNIPTNGHPTGWVCQTSGTIKGASGITATSASGSPTITISGAGNLLRNDYITIGTAFPNPTRVRRINGTSVTMESNAATTLGATSVVYPVPIFRPMGWVPGPSANKGDASVTLTNTDPTTVRFDTALTANRTVTLPASASSDHGQKYRIVRTGLGGFTLTVQDATPATLRVIPSATAAFVDVEFNVNTNTWQLAAYGAL